MKQLNFSPGLKEWVSACQ